MLVNLGIITNELLTNIMKYAFTGKKTGSITVILSMKNNQILYIKEDDGIGFPENVDFTNTTGFGLNLVKMITEQMNLSCSLDICFHQSCEDVTFYTQLKIILKIEVVNNYNKDN